MSMKNLKNKIQLKLLNNDYAKKLREHGIRYYKVIDPDNIIYSIKTIMINDDICNVYCGESTKLGLIVDSSKDIREQLEELKTYYINKLIN